MTGKMVNCALKRTPQVTSKARAEKAVTNSKENAAIIQAMAVIPISINNPPPQLRPLNILRDLFAVADLIESCFPSTLDEDGRRSVQQMRTSSQDNAFLRWAYKMADTVSLPLSGFVWEENGEIIGNVSLIPYRHERKRYFLIANVAVRPEHRRRGIGRALTLAAIQQAKAKNADEIWLHVRADNPGAIALYTSLGFREHARRTCWRVERNAPLPLQGNRIISRRYSRDWPLQKEYLRRLYPPHLDWYQPLPLHFFRPGLLPAIERVLLEEEVRHWVIRQGDDLAALTWRPYGSRDNLWAAVPPTGADDMLQALLLHARRELINQRIRLSLDLPAGQYVEAIQSTGFYPHRTLIWMRWDET
jgi:ribosomal protein S18 acetylase RimI-like enzyme